MDPKETDGPKPNQKDLIDAFPIQTIQTAKRNAANLFDDAPVE